MNHNQVVLFEPEIPANTGNIIRLCANTQTKLTLIGKLGFELDDKKLRRAGLDYHEFAAINQYDSWSSWRLDYPELPCIALSTKGTQAYHQIDLAPPHALVFGPETRGLPQDIRDEITCCRIPMAAQQRSLNLSNSVAIVLYEMLRQQHFHALD
jgi:tRNA (cytidine/uridine-2'-O-)-methyltransferase